MSGSELPEAWPTVSAVVPVHNGAAFIADALDSIAAQTRPVHEVIVVDDGSTDATASRAAGRPGVRVIRQAQTGPAAARNAGVAASTGAVVAFLDADDRWTPDKLALQVGHLLQHPHLGGVYAWQRLVLDPGIEPPDWAAGENARTAEHGATESTLVLRRWAWDRVGPMDPSLRYREDTDWLLRASECGVRLESIREVVLLRRLHGGNLTYDTAAMRTSLPVLFKRRIDRRRSIG